MQRFIRRLGNKTIDSAVVERDATGMVEEAPAAAAVAAAATGTGTAVAAAEATGGPQPQSPQPQQPSSQRQSQQQPQQHQREEKGQVDLQDAKNQPEPSQANHVRFADILPTQQWEAEERVQRDDDNTDADSALGSDAVSSTASLTSTILQYRTLHGRRYHSEMNNLQYWAANDERQTEVMDMNHHNLTLALGDRLFLAPLERDKIKKVLDVGTGTGIWAIDFADEFPDAEIIGTDISPIQPSWVPPNLQFEIEDCCQEWTFKPSTFDFIHMRWLVGSIADWDELFCQAYGALQPGGWLQSLETEPYLTSDDNSVPPTSAMGQWGSLFVEGGKKLGRSFSIVADGTQRKAMEAAGFVDIQEYDFKMPIGAWPKDPTLKQMGQFAEVVLDKDVEGYCLVMTNMLGWTREETIVYVSMLRRELRSRAFHAYYCQKVVWGRKPDTET